MPPTRPGVHYSVCGQCKRPVRRAACCPVCGQSCCRWGCYTHHVARHLAAPAACPEKPRQPTQEIRAAS